MRDLDRALADIVAIRGQIAAGAAFQGYGPAAVATTGLMAAATATAQWFWFGEHPEPLPFFAGWIVTALVAAILVAAEMWARSRRHHSGLADALVFDALATFLPAGASGALLGLVLWRCAPDLLWTLPGLWQILVGLGLFASLDALPRSVRWGAAWYLVAGLGTIAVGSEARLPSPWSMGIPFAVGQLLLAGLLHAAERGGHDA